MSLTPKLGKRGRFAKVSINEGSSNGRTTGSGPVNQGSNPCPSAKKVRGYEFFLITPFVLFLFRLCYSYISCIRANYFDNFVNVLGEVKRKN